MTTAPQVKKLVKPLLDRHADLALARRWIFVKPVHHFARGILIDSMLDPEKFRPQWAVVHLFQQRRFFPLSWGEMLYNEPSPRPGSWRMSDPDIASALIAQIEQRALPALRAMVTFDDYLSFVSQHYFRHKLFDWPDCRLIVEVALGDLVAAQKTCRDSIHLWSSDRPVVDEEAREKNRGLREFCTLLAADDRAGLAKTLHEWEATTVKNLKLAHLWEAPPFPLEMRTTGSP